MRFDEQRDRPQVSRQLLRRVAAYARSYRAPIVVRLVERGTHPDLLPADALYARL